MKTSLPVQIFLLSLSSSLPSGVRARESPILVPIVHSAVLALLMAPDCVDTNDGRLNPFPHQATHNSSRLTQKA